MAITNTPRMALQQGDPLLMMDPSQMAPQIQHPMHAMIAPIAPAPPPMMAAGTNELGVPQKSAKLSNDAPQMSALDQQETNAQSRLQKMQAEDANPYGSANNHPGFGGKLLHGLNIARNIGEQAFAPQIAMADPTSALHRGMTEKRLGAEVQGIEKQKSEQALQGATASHLNEETEEMPGKTQSEEGLQSATADNLRSETEARNQPSLQVHDTDQGPLLINPKTGAAQHIDLDGQPVGPKLKLTQSQPIMGPDNKPHTYMLDEKGNKVVDLGEHYERPVSVNVGRTEDHKEKAEILKTYAPALASAERFNVMAESYEKAVRDNDQQAMLNLLANHLGMTMGLQKGARITKDLYQEAAQSTPWLQKIGAKFSSDGYLSGVTLNPTQMRQMVSLAQSRYSEDVKAARAAGKYLGATDDGPGRDANDATQRYYLFNNGKDPAKARAAMQADGWTF